MEFGVRLSTRKQGHPPSAITPVVACNDNGYMIGRLERINIIFYYSTPVVFPSHVKRVLYCHPMWKGFVFSIISLKKMYKQRLTSPYKMKNNLFRRWDIWFYNFFIIWPSPRYATWRFLLQIFRARVGFVWLQFDATLKMKEKRKCWFEGLGWAYM